MDGLQNIMQQFGLNENFLQSKEFENIKNNLLSQMEAEEKKNKEFQSRFGINVNDLFSKCLNELNITNISKKKNEECSDTSAIHIEDAEGQKLLDKYFPLHLNSHSLNIVKKFQTARYKDLDDEHLGILMFTIKLDLYEPR